MPQWWLETGAASGRIFQKWTKIGKDRVASMSLEGAICIRTNQMMNKYLASSGFCTQVAGPETSFWTQNTAKLALKSTLFAYLFKFHLLVVCLTAMDCVRHLCDDK